MGNEIREIQKIRNNLLTHFFQRMAVGLFFFAVIALPLSLSRWPATGFLFVYAVQIALSLWVSFVFLKRKKLALGYHIVTVLGVFISICLSSLFSFGLMTANSTYAVLASFVVAFVWGKRAGVLAIIIYAFFVCIAAVEFINGNLTYAVEPNTFLSMPISWMSAVVSALIASAILLLAFAGVQKQIQNLINTIQFQNRKLEHLANHDPLTGLPSLRLANEKLDMALALAQREGGKVALLFLDLDGFKAINDEYGHDAGDEVLKVVAQRIKNVVRISDTPCRVGGDEFIVILTKTNGLDETAEVCTRLVQEVCHPIPFGPETLHVGLSVGGALYPDHAASAHDLIKMADEMMYEVKKSGKKDFLLPHQS